MPVENPVQYISVDSNDKLRNRFKITTCTWWISNNENATSWEKYPFKWELYNATIMLHMLLKK